MAVPQVIERWHRIALERRGDELAGILAEDAVFESPVVHTPQQGRAIVEAYLRGALEVLNTEHFRYGGEWYSSVETPAARAPQDDQVGASFVTVRSGEAASRTTQGRPASNRRSAPQDQVGTFTGGSA